MSIFKRLAVVSALATTAAVAGLVAPASAQVWATMGPYPSFEACFNQWIDFIDQYDTQRCAYWDLTGTANDGWYFKVAPNF